MKITVLTDNIAGEDFEAEHGLSYLVEIDGHSILFDTGHSDVFLKNARRLGIKLHKQVEAVVLSHGHWDHGNGLKYFSGKKLVAHPAVFSKRFRKSDHSYLGLDTIRAEIEKKYSIQTSKKPIQLTPNLWFLGEIPRINNFEAQNTNYVLDSGEDDFIFDDTALAARVDDNLVVISGCAHSGICNICEHAKKISGVSKIKTVIGGFHLKDKGEQSLKTLEYFSENKIETLLPAHCTAAPAKSLFRTRFQFPEVKTGMKFTF